MFLLAENPPLFSIQKESAPEYYHELELDADDEVSEILLDCHSKGRLANAFGFWEKDLEVPPFGYGYHKAVVFSTV